MGPMGNDEVNFALSVNNDEDILVFSSVGKAHRISVAKIPLYAKGTNGTDIRVINKFISSPIVCAAREETLKKLAETKKYKNFIFILTSVGYIKKIDITDILTAPCSGFVYSKLDQQDSVKSILFGTDKLELLIYADNRIFHIQATEVPYLKRSTKGSKVSPNINAASGMNFLIPNSTHIVIVTRSGMVNKIPLVAVPLSRRGKAGQKVIKLSAGDLRFSVWSCTDQNVLVVNDGKTRKVPVGQIPMGSTISRGNQMFNNPTRVKLE